MSRVPKPVGEGVDDAAGQPGERRDPHQRGGGVARERGTADEVRDGNGSREDGRRQCRPGPPKGPGRRRPSGTTATASARPLSLRSRPGRAARTRPTGAAWPRLHPLPRSSHRRSHAPRPARRLRRAWGRIASRRSFRIQYANQFTPCAPPRRRHHRVVARPLLGHRGGCRCLRRLGPRGGRHHPARPLVGVGHDRQRDGRRRAAVLWGQALRHHQRGLHLRERAVRRPGPLPVHARRRRAHTPAHAGRVGAGDSPHGRGRRPHCGDHRLWPSGLATPGDARGGAAGARAHRGLGAAPRGRRRARHSCDRAGHSGGRGAQCG